MLFSDGKALFSAVQYGPSPLESVSVGIPSGEESCSRRGAGRPEAARGSWQAVVSGVQSTDSGGLGAATPPQLPMAIRR